MDVITVDGANGGCRRTIDAVANTMFVFAVLHGRGHALPGFDCAISLGGVPFSGHIGALLFCVCGT